MILVSVGLFIVLALGEDYGRQVVKRWQRASAPDASEEIEKTVRRYDEILSSAYDQDRPSLLASVATEGQIRKVRLYMTYDQVEKKRKLVTELKSLSVSEIKRKGKKGTAKTTETWEYYYKDLNTGKSFGKKVINYEVSYNLIRLSGDWLVDSLDVKKI